jgi:FixJ family two-component response regulator
VNDGRLPGDSLQSPLERRRRAGLETRRLVIAVDDDPSFLRSVERVLAVNAFEVRGFTSLEALMDAGCLSEAACLLLDINLGEISGIEFRQQLKSGGLRIPVVFMTASDNVATQHVALESGCVAYLKKPFRERVLLDAVNRALASRAA